MNLNSDQLDSLFRRNFYSFLIRSFVELNPATEVAENWHIEVMAQELERCRLGEIKRLIVNLPPRSLKSHCASVALPAWIMGHNPSAQIICASYAQDLADKHAIDCRALMNSEFYQRLFPATRLSPEKRAVGDFLTTARGCRKATSVGGVLTGRGADFIIIDDPLQPDKALSDTRRNACNDWYDNTLVSRLNHKLTGCILIVMQRLHEDDLVGHVLETERRQAIDVEPKWNVVRFAAIADEEETHVVQRLGQTFTYTRRAGEILHPEREPREILDQLRETLGEYHFAGQYQQSPAPQGGGIVKPAWFKTYTESERPQQFDCIFQSWDTANKATELSDYSVCTTWGVLRTPGSTGAGSSMSWGISRVYLLDVLRLRLDYPELKRMVREHAARWSAKNVLIEDRASGTQLCQELVHEGMHFIQKCQPKNDKIMRMHTVTSTIKNGFVYLPEKAPWLAQYVHELATFPNGKHDDQADSTSQALDWMKSFLFEPGIVQYYRREAEKLKTEQQQTEPDPPPRLTREWYYRTHGMR
ncbi:MAG TPA: phage terminase large subunit [Terriglobales bacterium]|jgi:predicted phage terminase large subunit-like protein|nr:phage terminase large subunit [Terriglobales bacterium]